VRIRMSRAIPPTMPPRTTSSGLGQLCRFCVYRVQSNGGV
jgi:hypothetical protein